MLSAKTGDFTPEDHQFMQRALALAKRGYGGTSPNPMVGAVLVSNGKIIGEGWHRRAGEPHAEINAISAARSADLSAATLYVTLEPCSSHGRTPPCTEAILAKGIPRVIVATRDPNPKHAGKGLRDLRRQSVEVLEGLCEAESRRLNEAFNYWIVRREPFVHLKSAMSLDSKIATKTGESKWITGEKARAYGMRLRLGVDAIVVGVNTVIRDDPLLTLRGLKIPPWKSLRRIVLDPNARTPISSKLLTDEHSANTTIVVGPEVAGRRRRHLEKRVRVIEVPLLGEGLDLRKLLSQLQSEGATSVLVEGGGETHFNFLAQSLVNRIHFFYAPIVITGRSAPKSVGGATTLGTGLRLRNVEWNKPGKDLLLTALLK